MISILGILCAAVMSSLRMSRNRCIGFRSNSSGLTGSLGLIGLAMQRYRTSSAQLWDMTPP